MIRITMNGDHDQPEWLITINGMRSQGAATLPRLIYRHRNLIERCWSRLKERRAIATRYDKTTASYAAGIAIAASLDWFKSPL